MYLGIHISNKEFQNLVNSDDSYGINAIQYMPTTPMRWVTEPIPDDEITKFVDGLEKTEIKKVLLHGIYLTNLARKDKQLFHLGKMGLFVYLDFAERVSSLIEDRGLDIEILGVCFHPGSQKELSKEESLERISYGIQWVLDKVAGKQKLLIETTAGSGATLGDTFEELKQMRDGVKDKDRVGFVVDTEHTFASGYDWVNNFSGVVNDLDKYLGINNVKSFHLNDSMVDCGSHKDRHADLGDGKLGVDCMKEILNYKEFRNIPFILETPALKEHLSLINEIKVLKELAK